MIKFFCDFFSYDSAAALISSLLLGLLGLVIGWILWGRYTSKLREDLAARDSELETLRVENNSLTDKNNVREADLTMANAELDNLKASFNVIRNRNEELSKIVDESEMRFQQLQSDLDAQNALTDNAEGDEARSLSSSADASAIEARLADLEAENAELRNDLENMRLVGMNAPVELEIETPAVEASSTELEIVNLAAAEMAPEPIEEAVPEPATEVEPEPVVEVEPEPVVEVAPEPVAAPEPVVEVTPEPVVEAAPKQAPAVTAVKMTADPIQRIEGIGPKTAALFNGAGVYTFKQIAEMSVSDLQTLLNQGGDRYSLLRPDTWAIQAGLLANGEDNRFETYVGYLTAGVDTDGKGAAYLSGQLEQRTLIVSPTGQRSDDLTVIEGIGPKISELLTKESIGTWFDLASSNEETLKAILTNAGSRFAVHNPATWPKQASLLCEQRWDEFAAYTQYLNSGKIPE